MSNFIKSGDFEVDATPAQRTLLHAMCGIQTGPEFLPTQIVAKRCGIEYLTKGKAESLLSAIGKEYNIEGIREARHYLLSIALPGADKGPPKALRSKLFDQLWTSAIEAGKTAASITADDELPAIVLVSIGPGTTAFAKWLLERGYAQKNTKGVSVICPGDRAQAIAYAKAVSSAIESASICKQVEVCEHEIPAALLEKMNEAKSAA